MVATMVLHESSSRRFYAKVLGALVLCGAGMVALDAQAPKTHRLEASPATVAYGYYWAEAKPVLTVNSGDIVDVDTM